MSRLILILLTTALFCMSAIANTPADKIFPDATKGFVSIKNLKEFGEQWKQTQFGKLLDDPLMQDFKNEVQKQITERMERSFGLTLDAISSLPSGEVAFGMIAIPSQIPGYVLTMDVTGQRAETDKYLADLTQKLISTGTRRTTETYKGQQITILTFPPAEPIVPRARGGAARPEPAIEPVERKAHYMFFQDILIAADQMHLLKLIADRIADQTGRSLADVEAYQVVMKRCIDDISTPAPPIIRWYIEPLDYGESIRVLLRGPIAQGRREKPSIFTILKQHGFDAIQGIGGVVTVKTEAQETVYRTFVYTKKPYRLAMRMLEFPESTNFAPPAWMPDDLARCTMLYVDPLAIFDNVGVLFDAFLGEEGVWKDILDGLRNDPDGPKIDVREELVVNLGNRVMGMSRYEKPITAKSESLVVAVELKPGREPAMLAGMEKFFGTDPEMDFIQYKSYKIWHRKPMDDTGFSPDIQIEGMPPDIFNVNGVDFPPSLVDVAVVPVAQRNLLLEEDDTPPPVFPDGGVVVAKGCLFLATNIDYLKVILDRLDSPAESARSTIANELEYREVDRIFASLGLTDKPHFFQFFARTHETMRPTYEMLRRNEMAQSQAVVARVVNALLTPEGVSDAREQILDGSTLPEFDRVQHYFGKVGIFGVTEENGYFIKGFMVERE